MTQRIVSVLLDRNREYTRAEEQIGKLAALNKLAANLAHELNNPASAAKSAASQLFSASDTGHEHTRYRLGMTLGTEDGLNAYLEWLSKLRSQASFSRHTTTENSFAGSTSKSSPFGPPNRHSFRISHRTVSAAVLIDSTTACSEPRRVMIAAYYVCLFDQFAQMDFCFLNLPFGHPIHNSGRNQIQPSQNVNWPICKILHSLNSMRIHIVELFGARRGT
jgi:hypothetical protein